MKVITLDKQDFRKECRRLRASVLSAGFIPDGVIAIASGGVYVAEEMGYTGFHTMTLRRKGTVAKRRFLDRFMQHLPYFVTDFLRIAESHYLEFRQKGKEVSFSPAPLDGKLCDFLSTRPRRILIVDDAVDSGATLMRASETLKRLLPEADIRSAVLTVTRKNPAITPDFKLYSDRTLIRFPWSGDFKK